MHHWLHRAGERGLACQFHTGLQEGNGNLLARSDPLLLNPLFLVYPGVRFDLFHVGWPFTETATALCKIFPNVFIDMCWAQSSRRSRPAGPCRGSSMRSRSARSRPLAGTASSWTGSTGTCR